MACVSVPRKGRFLPKHSLLHVVDREKRGRAGGGAASATTHSKTDPRSQPTLPPPANYDKRSGTYSTSSLCFPPSPPLQTLTLSQYQEAFIAAAVDGAFLYDLNDDDLKSSLGVEHRLHRKKILNSINRLKAAEAERVRPVALNTVSVRVRSPAGSNLRCKAREFCS